ncbi:MAG: phage major capsid protein [Firmicutes bacterium]|nr:phage major capsid protein [Bacillota bacterium]
MVTLQRAEDALKSVYLGTVTELLNTKINPLLAKIEQTSQDVWGKEIRKAAKFGINGGIGAGDEAGELPSAAPNNYLQFVTTLKNLYGQIEISDKAIRASSDERGAFTDLLNAELEGLLEASRFNLGRMLYGDGTGILGRVTAMGSNPQVDKPHNFIEGMVVDLYSPDGNFIRSGLRVAHVNRDTNRIRFECNSIIANNHQLCVQGSRGKEITGLGALFDPTRDIYGISRDRHPFLVPHIAEPTAMSEIAIQKAIDRLETHANSVVDFIAVSADVKYEYQEFLGTFKRNIDIMELEGGFRTLSYNGIPVVYDRFVDPKTMYLLNTKAFKLHQLSDWRYLETENGKILRQTQGKPTYSATLVKYCDLICDRPNGQAKLTGFGL